MNTMIKFLKLILIGIATILLVSCGNSEEVLEKETKDLELTKPSILLVGENEIRIFVGDQFQDPGSLVSDQLDGIESYQVFSDDSVNSNEPGEYILTYSYSNKNGISSETIERLVKVVQPTQFDLFDLSTLQNNYSLPYDNSISFIIASLDSNTITDGIKLQGEYSGFLDYSFDYEDSMLTIIPTNGFRANEVYTITLNNKLKSVLYDIDYSSSIRFKLQATEDAKFYDREIEFEIDITSIDVFDFDSDGNLNIVGNYSTYNDDNQALISLVSTDIMFPSDKTSTSSYTYHFTNETYSSHINIGTIQFSDTLPYWFAYNKINGMDNSISDSIFIFNQQLGEELLYKSKYDSEEYRRFKLNDYIDLNGDGINDLLVTENIGKDYSRLFLLISKGDDIFPNFEEIEINQSNNIAAKFVDWDSDFDFDIVFIAGDDLYLSKYNEGMFSSGSLLDEGYYNYRNFIVDDFNNDKRLDIATIYYGDIVVSYNNPDSLERNVVMSTSYDVTSDSLVSADLNSDGRNDIIFSVQSGSPFFNSSVFQTLNESDGFSQLRAIYDSRGSIFNDAIVGIDTDGSINLISRESNRVLIR
jgi:hypothetical protein